jgi:uncharacterized RDD family membrane protein YckC
MLDLIIISLITTPIISFIYPYLFIYYFQDFFVARSIDINDNIAISKMVASQEFIDYITFQKFIIFSSNIFLINVIFTAIYFIMFWRKFSATPGKIILRMKIVDADNFNTPSTYNLIKRFFGYITVFIGIWSILFNKRGMAMHDKIANTVVVKK